MRVPATNRILEVYYVSVKRFAAVPCKEMPLRTNVRLGYVHSNHLRLELRSLYTIVAVHVHSFSCYGMGRSLP